VFGSSGNGTAAVTDFDPGNLDDTSATHIRVSGGDPADNINGIYPIINVQSGYDDDPASPTYNDAFEQVRFTYSGPFISTLADSVSCNHETGILAETSVGNIILNGTGFANTETVLFSSNNSSIYTSLTSLSATTRQPAISGQSIPFTIVNDNTITFSTPVLAFDGDVRFIPYNKAGYSFSDSTLETETFSGNTTFIKITS